MQTKSDNSNGVESVCLRMSFRVMIGFVFQRVHRRIQSQESVPLRSNSCFPRDLHDKDDVMINVWLTYTEYIIAKISLENWEKHLKINPSLFYGKFFIFTVTLKCSVCKSKISLTFIFIPEMNIRISKNNIMSWGHEGNNTASDKQMFDSWIRVYETPWET